MKEFKDFNKRELVDLVCQMMDSEQGEGREQPAIEAVMAERERLGRRSRLRRAAWGMIAVLLAAAAIAVLLSTLLLPIIQVSGDSMEPTLSSGDILMLLKTKNYQCGELCCISWQNKMLLKRVIALPGDTVEMDAEGNVYRNGALVDEPYLTEKCLGECDMTFPFQVPEDQLFVLGDRRSTSIDSRSSAIGCVSYEQMIGRVLFRLWSTEG